MTVDGRKIGLGIACWLLLVGACSAPPMAKARVAPTPASSETASASSKITTAPSVVPSAASALPALEEPSSSTEKVFRCDARTPSAARISASFKTDWLVYDGNGAEADGSTLLDAQVSLSIEPTETGASLTLQELRDAPSLQYGKLGYREGLDQHWLELGKPFTLEHRGKDWCFADRRPCPAKAALERDFTRALGQGIELLSPLSELSSALDGKPNDGKRALELPLLLIQRLGLKRSQPISAAQVNLGFPARFEAHLHAETTELVAAETSGGQAPRTRARDITLRAELDEHCRLVHYEVEQDARTTIVPGTQSTSRLIHTRKYSVQY